MIGKNFSLMKFLADLQWLYEQAIEKSQLAVALRIKELQIKYTRDEHPLSLKDFTDEELQTLLLTLDRSAGETCDNALLKDKDQEN